ncbi:MAG: hypothetical protein JJ992_10020 [Planctomycetes bacterium]|nr:hypothetical protein [Planctomycetota bacterium]
MSNEQTRDILEHAQHFHRQVSQYYDELSAHTDKERIKMLLDYMSRHERNMARGLAEFEHSAPRDVMNACFKVGHVIKPCCEVVQDLKITPDMSVDDVIEMGMQFGDCLISVYKDLSETAADERVRSVFQDLLTLEQKEKRQLVRNAQRVLDF